jgi:hypothetical protein
MSLRVYRIAAGVLGLFATAALAAPADRPAVETQNGAGTNIVGEQESAVGLYLMPWQEETAGDVDRPPALSSEPLQPIDPARFEGRVRTDEAIAAYRRAGVNRN